MTAALSSPLHRITLRVSFFVVVAEMSIDEFVNMHQPSPGAPVPSSSAIALDRRIFANSAIRFRSPPARVVDVTPCDTLTTDGKSRRICLELMARFLVTVCVCVCVVLPPSSEIRPQYIVSMPQISIHSFKGFKSNVMTLCFYPIWWVFGGEDLNLFFFIIDAGCLLLLLQLFRRTVVGKFAIRRC